MIIAPTQGGSQTLLNVTAPVVVKAAPGLLCRIVVSNTGTAGTIVANDATTVGGASASNQIGSWAYNSNAITGGDPLELFWPCANGIVISQITTGGVLSVSFD